MANATGASEFWEHTLPAINACFNGLSATLLLAGWLAIRRRAVKQHMVLMLSALTSSSLFLVGYLARMTQTGAHRFVGPDWVRYSYLAILGTHMVLAVALLPLLGYVLYYAWHAEFARHRGIARITWPIWMYVSVTGVVVYWMLYWLAPSFAVADATMGLPLP